MSAESVVAASAANSSPAVAVGPNGVEYFRFVHDEADMHALFNFIAFDDDAAVTATDAESAARPRNISVQCIARRKYDPAMRTTNCIFGADSTTVYDGADFVRFIRRREVSVGTYVDDRPRRKAIAAAQAAQAAAAANVNNNNKNKSPQQQQQSLPRPYVLRPEASGCYVVPNPDNAYVAVRALVTEFDTLCDAAVSAALNRRASLAECDMQLRRFCRRVPRAHHGHMMRTVTGRYIHLDIDVKTAVGLRPVLQYMRALAAAAAPAADDGGNGDDDNDHDNDTTVTTRHFCVETRNGYHLLVDTTHTPLVARLAHKMFGKHTKKFIVRDPVTNVTTTVTVDPDVSVCNKGSPIPIPGTYVGGFAIRVVPDFMAFLVELCGDDDDEDDDVDDVSVGVGMGVGNEMEGEEDDDNNDDDDDVLDVDVASLDVDGEE